MLDIVNKYLDYLKFQKNYSYYTIDSYRRDIEKFLIFMNDEGYTLQSVDQVLIRNFLARETISRISKRSNARRIIAMRRFYEYLVREEVVINNPFYSGIKCIRRSTYSGFDFRNCNSSGGNFTYNYMSCCKKS